MKGYNHCMHVFNGTVLHEKLTVRWKKWRAGKVMANHPVSALQCSQGPAFRQSIQSINQLKLFLWYFSTHNCYLLEFSNPLMVCNSGVDSVPPFLSFTFLLPLFKFLNSVSQYLCGYSTYTVCLPRMKQSMWTFTRVWHFILPRFLWYVLRLNQFCLKILTCRKNNKKH